MTERLTEDVAPAVTDRTHWMPVVDGARLSSQTQIEVRSPYDGRVVAEVASVGGDATRRAVDAAAAAMAVPLPGYLRAEILDSTARRLRSEAQTFAQWITKEAGKPIRAALAEVKRAASTLELSAVEARTLAGSVVPMEGTVSGSGKFGFTIRIPIGIVGAISPFNFPLNLVAHKVGPALAAGCAVVLKPARQTPVTSLLLAEMFEQAGLPSGWLNVVVGPSAEIGDVLVDDDRVKLISFTGSAAIGWNLSRRAHRKRVTLELGNAAPVIVTEDADLNDAAAKTAMHAYSNAGQSCISIQRVYVHQSRYDAFVGELVNRVEKLTVGDPMNPATDVGPVIDRDNRDRILSWIAESGGTVAAGGDLSPDGLIRPTVVCRPHPESKLVREEVFGPVCTVSPYAELDEAIAAANSTELGLQAAIFTNNYRTALAASRQLEFGAVIVNEAPTWRADQMPYGGIKDSGNTKEGPSYTVRAMTEERLVVLDL